MAKKELTNDKITIVGLLCSFIFGLFIGGFVYLAIKMFNLKSNIWYILFIFTPPLIGALIYWQSKAKAIK